MRHYLHNSLRALFLSLAVLMSLPMLAEQVEIDGINYNLDAEAKQATVIAKSSGEYSGEIVIPDSVEHEGVTYCVTSIGDNAFQECFGLTSVTIGNSVTSIGIGAFDRCSGLTSATIGNRVKNIWDRAFYGCTGLTSVAIPNRVTSIGECAFQRCKGLTSVTIPNSVTSIGSSAFDGCSGLTSVHISDIAAWCNIDFKDSNSNPLYYAHHLYLNGEEVKDLVIPNSVTSIGGKAFYRCTGLTSVTIGNGVESIGEHAFSSCSGLTSVTIPNSVTSIESFAFSGCSGLTSVTIPNSVTSIEYGAFDGCSGLTSVTIPNSVKSIGWYAFEGCTGLTSVTIPNSVTSIEYSAFRDCSGLISVTIPNSVTSIGDCAFFGCSGLTSVTIPNSVTSIGDRVFCKCTGLTSVTIPNSVTRIWDWTFGYCKKILDVYCYAEKVPSTSPYAFSSSSISIATLHVPDASIDSYKATEPWSSFGSIIGLSGEQPEVEKCASPVVTYADGKLSFSCDTEGTEFVTNITDSDIKKHYDAEIELSATYNIEVFAIKANCENSDTVSVALVWVENGEVNEETGIISVEAAPVLVQGNSGVLSVSGVAKGTEVVVYTVSGTEVARATATEGQATISTGLQSGTIVVVKFGSKSVKVRI